MSFKKMHLKVLSGKKDGHLVSDSMCWKNMNTFFNILYHFTTFILESRLCLWWKGTTRAFFKGSLRLLKFSNTFFQKSQYDLMLIIPLFMFKRSLLVNPLGTCDAIWRHRSWSTLAQIMACCLMAPSHYMSQCWLIISHVLTQSPQGNFTKKCARCLYMACLWKVLLSH